MCLAAAQQMAALQRAANEGELLPAQRYSEHAPVEDRDEANGPTALISLVDAPVVSSRGVGW